MDKIKTDEFDSMASILFSIAKQCAAYGATMISINAHSIYAEFAKDNQDNN